MDWEKKLALITNHKSMIDRLWEEAVRESPVWHLWRRWLAGDISL